MQILKTSLWILWIILTSHTHGLFGQNVGIGTIGPDASAMLDVASSEKGILIPRMSSAQRTAIAAPANGLMVYDTDTGSFWFYQASGWKNLSALPDRITDADGNTRVMVEKNPNEDMIRFELAGEEKMVFRQNSNGHPRMEIYSPGDNISIGELAGASTTSGTGNVAFGSLAFTNNLSGFNNVAIGSNSMVFNTNGKFNTALGALSLFTNVSNNRNTAVGTYAMLYAHNGQSNVETHNTAVGVEAMRGSTNSGANTGRYNTAVGDQSMREITSGSENTAIGFTALSKNTSGFSNTALGGKALQDNVLGFDNSAVGVGSLQKNTSGCNNTGLGSDALTENTTGNNNTAVGFNALSGNVAGIGNLGLGYGANVSSGNLVYASAIGYFSEVGCSNCMVLGGTGIHSVNVGIGVQSPTERLHVKGNIRVDDGRIIQESVINPTLNTGWTNLGNQWEVAGYYKGKDGRVYLQGTIVKNAGSGNVVFSLPTGYRPAKQLRFSAYRHDGLTTFISIDSFGSVLESGAPNGSQISLDGISFRVE
ncbi:MAG: hypothetical protein IPM42_14510 [Saprospiraceae bacterium]|nr:hypothetical protein [Saprospiraceae bacterium]